jgi:hypothetical protein
MVSTNFTPGSLPLFTFNRLARRRLGGSLPTYLEIRSASLDTRVKVELTDQDCYKDNTVALCIKVLSKVCRCHGFS